MSTQPHVSPSYPNPESAAGVRNGEPYAPAPTVGGGGANPYADFRPVDSAPTGSVGATYERGLEHAAQAGVEVAGARLDDGTFLFPGTESIDRSRVFSGPGYLAPLPRRSGWAVPALWFSIIGVVAFPLLPVGLVLGILGLRDTRDGTVAGRSASRAAVILAIMASVIWVMIWYIYYAARS